MRSKESIPTYLQNWASSLLAPNYPYLQKLDPLLMESPGMQRSMLKEQYWNNLQKRKRDLEMEKEIFKSLLSPEEYRKQTEQQETGLPKEFSDRIARLRGLPFWILPDDITEEDIKEYDHSPKIKESFAKHAQLYDEKYDGEFENSWCCFNHAIGLPRKFGVPKPLFDYELLMYYYMYNHKWKDIDGDSHVGVKRLGWLKSRGLGGTQFNVRNMAWLATRNDDLKDSFMAILTGPRITLAIDILSRMKTLFWNKLGVAFPYNNVTLWLNHVRINTFPSHKIQAFRGLENVSYIFFDEADFAPRNQQFELLSVSLGYIPKSNPYMMFLSTPGEINGLMQSLEIEWNELNEEAMFRFIRTPYEFGLGKVYTPYDIKVLQKRPDVFDREMRLNYGVGSGAIFTVETLNQISHYGEMFDFDTNYINPFTEKVMSIDPGYGDSHFAICIMEYLADTKNVRVIYAQQWGNIGYDEALRIAEDLITIYNPQTCYIDASQRGFITTLKQRIGEDTSEEYQKHLERQLKVMRDEIIKSGGRFKRVKYLEEFMRIVPFSYTNNKKEMLSHAKTMCEIEGMVCINQKKFAELFLDLQTARRNNGMLIKNKDAPMDLFETLMQACWFWSFQ